MSLIKQLWIGIIVMLLLAMGGSFAISLISAKYYLEDQLHLKNIDNANSLALSLSQLEKDPVTLELLISAQFDTGHYEFIKLISPQKKVLISREYDRTKTTQDQQNTPQWFTKLVNFDAPEGIAQVQDGWQQYGTLMLKSQSAYAWQSMWNNTKQLLEWFVIAALLSGVLGSIALMFISTPLEVVIKQAEAISERRFITSEEPKTTEFLRLVRAMNILSKSVRIMLEKETKQLDVLRKESQLDALTALPNREHFLNLLESLLQREDSSSNGVIVIIRVLNLADLNHQLGHAATDHALLQIAGVLHQFIENHSGSFAGRLNGCDFMLAITGNPSAQSVGSELSEKLSSHLKQLDLSCVQLPIATCTYHSGDKRREILHKLDGALAQAELKGNRALIALSSQPHPMFHRNLNEWREEITKALDQNQLRLAEFSVQSTDGTLLHYEAPVRLYLDNQWQPAGYFMPWAARLGILPAIDLNVLKTALCQLEKKSVAIAINLSAEALCNATFREQALTTLQHFAKLTSHLYIEFPEACALRHMAEFRQFAMSLSKVGCKVGLEHAGLEFTKIGECQDIGLHYLKIDSAIIRDIDTNTGNQIFLRGMCQIGHSLGIMMIAEGVNNEAEKQTLIKLGINAVTGPWI